MRSEVTYRHPSTVDVYSQLPEQAFGTGSFLEGEEYSHGGMPKNGHVVEYGSSAGNYTPSVVIQPPYHENPLKPIVDQLLQENAELRQKLCEKKETQTKWEYKSMPYYVGLDEMGNEGWELCAASGDGSSKYFYFKRKVL